jgi:DNA-binding response OmpR family regulator
MASLRRAWGLHLKSTVTSSIPILIVDDRAGNLAVHDRKMPDSNGYQLTRLILELKANPSLPIIFVSGHRMDGMDVHLGYGAPGVDYVCKPFNPAIVGRKVSDFADLYRQRAALAESADMRGRENALLLQMTSEPSSTIDAHERAIEQ